MKKIICFVLGLLIGATGVFYFGDYLKDDSDKTTVSQVESTDSYNTSEKEDNNNKYYDYKEVSIDIPSRLSHWATFGDDIGFSWPSEELLNPYRGGDDFIYDMQENGKAVLINCYGVGMSKMMTDIYVTSDSGKSWKAVWMDKSFLNGSLDVVYIGDTIIIITVDNVYMNTRVEISNNNGKSFESTIKEGGPISLAYLIGESPDLLMMAFPVILSKDTGNNTVLCAWCRDSYNRNEVLLISEHDGTTFEITKEFYRNNTEITDLIKEYNG
ncbi:MAG: hypothetical protein IKJ41_08595 [Clostridia bacterium]|nr:hypothetical protein [Clostridia bacterium]